MAPETKSSNDGAVPPLNLLSFLKEESGQDLFSLSQPDLRKKLLNGLILRDKKENTETQFYWMDEKSSSNCFMLLPKSLRISAESRQVPCYIEEKWCTGKEIKLPCVKYEGISQLKVGGKFYTKGLSGEGTKYEVVLSLQLKRTDGSSRIYSAASMRLSLPDGSQTQKPWALVGHIPFEKWHPFQVDTFLMNGKNVGELSFDLQVAFMGRPDVLIQGVAIRPPSA